MHTVNKASNRQYQSPVYTVQNVSITENTVNHVFNQHYGGFWMSLKLFCSALVLSFKNTKKMPFERFKLLAKLIICSPYILFIKPIGWFFVKKTVIKGKFRTYNGVVDDTNVKKTTYWKFMAIPFLVYWSEPSKADWGKLLKS